MHGRPVREEEHTYLASLQLNEDHVCSSSLFKEGFLLTTKPCGSHLLDGMTKKNKTGTAVLGNFNFKTGQRIIILEISISNNRGGDDANVGIVVVSCLKSLCILPSNWQSCLWIM